MDASGQHDSDCWYFWLKQKEKLIHPKHRPNGDKCLALSCFAHLAIIET
jgi:hypothetical protein